MAVGMVLAGTDTAVFICVRVPVLRLMPYEVTFNAPWLITRRTPAGRDEPPQLKTREANAERISNPISRRGLIHILSFYSSGRSIARAIRNS